jgi:hypothetical protein
MFCPEQMGDGIRTEGSEGSKDIGGEYVRVKARPGVVISAATEAVRL